MIFRSLVIGLLLLIATVLTYDSSMAQRSFQKWQAQRAYVASGDAQRDQCTLVRRTPYSQRGQFPATLIEDCYTNPERY